MTHVSLQVSSASLQVHVHDGCQCSQRNPEDVCAGRRMRNPSLLSPVIVSVYPTAYLQG